MFVIFGHAWLSECSLALSLSLSDLVNGDARTFAIQTNAYEKPILNFKQ